MLRNLRPTIALIVSQQDERERQLHVGQPHQHRRRPALHEACQQAEQTAGHRRHYHRADADEQRQAGAVPHAGQQVTAELIGAERVAGRAGRLEARDEIGTQRILRSQPRGGHRGDEGGQRQPQAQVLLHALRPRHRARGAWRPRNRMFSSSTASEKDIAK
jgi:hypothetical protein